MRLLEAEGRLPGRIAFEEVELGRILSEEITPEDWARLIAAIDDHLRQGKASGHRHRARHRHPRLDRLARVLALPEARGADRAHRVARSPRAREGSDAIPNAARGHPGGVEPRAGRVRGLRRPGALPAQPPVRAGGSRRLPQLEPVPSPCTRAAPCSPTPRPSGSRERCARASKRRSTARPMLRVYPGMRADHLIDLMERGRALLRARAVRHGHGEPARIPLLAARAPSSRRRSGACGSSAPRSRRASSTSRGT